MALEAFAPSGLAVVPVDCGQDFIMPCRAACATVHGAAICLHCADRCTWPLSPMETCPARCPRLDDQCHHLLWWRDGARTYSGARLERKATVWHETQLGAPRWRITWGVRSGLVREAPTRAYRTLRRGVSTWAAPFGQWEHLGDALDVAKAWIEFGLMPFDPVTGAVGAWVKDWSNVFERGQW